MTRTNFVLLVLLTLVTTAAATLHVDFSRPNYEIMPDMKYSPAAKAYEVNAVFANRRTLQSPIQGTIARGALPLHYSASKEDAVRAGEELKNPYASVVGDPEAQATLSASIARGGHSFRVFCTACHGATGLGDGQVTKRGFPPPPSILTGKSLQMQDGQLFHILTYGQGSMSDFAAQISPDRRWDLINFVRSLQQQASATVPTTNALLSPDANAAPQQQPAQSDPELSSNPSVP